MSVQPSCADEADCIQYCLEQQERVIMSMRFNVDSVVIEAETGKMIIPNDQLQGSVLLIHAVKK